MDKMGKSELNSFKSLILGSQAGCEQGLTFGDYRLPRSPQPVCGLMGTRQQSRRWTSERSFIRVYNRSPSLVSPPELHLLLESQEHSILKGAGNPIVNCVWASLPPPSMVCVKSVFYETGHWCQKSWVLLGYCLSNVAGTLSSSRNDIPQRQIL